MFPLFALATINKEPLLISMWTITDGGHQISTSKLMVTSSRLLNFGKLFPVRRRRLQRL
jgi:hypothetical protein